jgi:cysteine dioxygenase
MFLNLINNIKKQLIENKVIFESEKIKKIIEEYNSDDWKKYVNEKNEKKIKIYENELFDIYIIKWDNNEFSKIHNHADNGCWLKVLQGSLQENLYDKNFNFIKNTILKKDDINFIKNSIGYHNIINYEENSITLHIYSPPGHVTEYY